MNDEPSLRQMNFIPRQLLLIYWKKNPQKIETSCLEFLLISSYIHSQFFGSHVYELSLVECKEEFISCLEFIFNSKENISKFKIIKNASLVNFMWRMLSFSMMLKKF
jgi:hypothetical protein